MVDGRAFELFFFWVAGTIYLLFSLYELRFICTWTALRRLLRRLYWHPTGAAYETLRIKSLASRPDAQRIRLFEPVPSLKAAEYALGLARSILEMGACSTSVISQFAQRISEAESRLRKTLQTEADGSRAVAVEARKGLGKIMVDIDRDVVSIFEGQWRLGSSGAPAKMSPELAEEGDLFVATRVVEFLRMVFPQMMNLVGFGMVGVLAMMLGLSVYPFPGRDTLVWVSWIVLLSYSATAMTVFVQINRDRIVSMLSGTDLGRFNWDSAFWVHLLMFVLIPVLSLMGAQFPHALSGIFAWIGALFGGSGGS